MVGFRICDNKGFHITFSNKVTVSVQFGPGNYCENYDESFNNQRVGGTKSSDAEIGIWKEGGEWITKEYPEFDADVVGNITPDTLLKVLNWAKKYGI